MKEVPPIKVFRRFVDRRVKQRRPRALIQTLYLTACRMSECLTKVSPSDRLSGRTDSYGKELQVTMTDYIELSSHAQEVEKVLLYEMRNSHRKEVKYRLVALPLNPKYDPWVLQLARYILDNKKQANFNISRQTAYKIVQRELKPLFKKYKGEKSRKSPLRHWRLTHLVEYYGFDPYSELIAFAGWTFSGSRGGAARLDDYVHLDWRNYFPKLLRPLPKT